MLRKLRTVAAAAVVVLGASVAHATNRGVPAGTGDKFTADISTASDVDTYVLPIGEGGLLSISAKQYKSTLLPGVTLIDPDGNGVSLTAYTKGSGTKSVSVKKVPIDQTGIWAVRVTGQVGGTTGAYTVSFTYKPPKTLKLKAAGIPATLDSFFTMAGDDGSLLTLSVKEKSGPPLNNVRIADPEGNPITVPPETPIVKKKTTWSGKKILLNQGLGDYRLVLTGSPIGSTVCDISLSVKPAKHLKVKALLGPEPDIVSLVPNGGRDGAAITITGANLSNPGVRVFFGEEEATGLVLTPNGPNLDVDCLAPLSTESDLGKLVPLFVQNADGQGNAVDFQYHGTPGPSTVSPLFAPLAGGNVLTITGTNNSNRFVPGGTYTVTVGGTGATVQTVLANTITIEAPNLGAPGAADIVVTDPYGRSGPTIAGLEYVGAPTFDEASPTSCSFEGGRIITVEGSGFRTGAKVYVDGAEANPVTVVDSTTLKFPMPGGPSGFYDLEVTDEFAQSAGLMPGYLRRRGPFNDISAATIPTPDPNRVFFASEMALGDIDGDDFPDFVFSSNYDTSYGTFFIFHNDGTGAFADETAGRAPVFTQPDDVGQAAAIAMGDLDGAPGLDIAMSVRDPFVADDPFVYYAAGPIYVAFSVYDPTGDTNDLVLDYQTYPSTRILSNNGAGMFVDSTGAAMPVSASAPIIGVGERFQAADCAIGDLDGGNGDDLVLVSPYVFYSAINYYYYHSDLLFGSSAYDVYVLFHGAVNYVPATRVFLNDGSGNLSQAAVLPAVSYFPDNFTAKEACGADAVALGDMDGDGSLDIVLALDSPAYYDPVGPTIPAYYLPATRVLLNDGYGTGFSIVADSFSTPFGATPEGAGSGEYWQADCLALGDLDGDGDQDIVLGRRVVQYWQDAQSAWQLTPAIRIFRNDGTANFTEDTGGFLPSTSYMGHSTNTILGIRSIRIGDLDGDGSADIVVTGHYSGQYDYNNTGYGPFGFIPSGDRPATRLLMNDGAGMFSDATDAWFPAAVNGDYFQSDALGMGDLDGDGDIELVLGYADYPDTALITTGHNSPLRVMETE